MKKDITEVIMGLNTNAIAKLGKAIEEGSKSQPNKIVVMARYGDEDWIKAIRKKQWKLITKMYNSTRFGTIMKIANLFKVEE